MFAMKEIKTIHIEGILLFFCTRYCYRIHLQCGLRCLSELCHCVDNTQCQPKQYREQTLPTIPRGIQSDKSELKRVVKTSWDRNHDNRLSLMNVNACILIRYDKVWQFLLLVYVNTYLAILFKLINHDP